MINLLPHGIAGRFRPEALFRPRAVAVIGADTAQGGQVLGNLMGGGFNGAVLPVAPGVAALAGVLAYDSIAALPVAPDLAVIAGPCDIPATFRALAERGTRAAIATGMAAGLRAAAQANGLRVLGPGSFGISVPGIGLNATCGHLRPRAGRLALVSQSAALCRAVLDWAEPNGVGFSHIVGTGGNEDIGFSLVLDWLSRDQGTGAILLDIRGIRDARLFLSAARAAARLRPVVAIRAGGLLMDPSGDAEATFVAALNRSGVLCVDSLEDLLAAAETLTRARPSRGEGLAIVTNAIGPAQLAADAALREHLQLARLAPETREVMRMAVPNSLAGRTGQPAIGDIVYVGPQGGPRLAEAAALLAGAREVGGVLVVHSPTGAEDETAIAALAAAGATLRVPLLACVMGETTGAPHRRLLAQAGVPVFAAPEQAVRGFRHLVQDRRNRAAARELPPSTVLEIAPDRAAVRAIFAAVQEEGRLMLTQDEAMAVLGAYGIPTVPTEIVHTAEGAAAAAARLGFPAVLKRRRLGPPDRARRGNLALDLRDADAVRHAAALVRDAPNAALLVQPQVGRARELLLQVREDPVFGPAIGFGQGGTAAELLHEARLQDIQFDLPPLNLPLARALIARARVAATLGPLNDQPAAQVEAVADALVRISQLVVDFPSVAALEVNPLFAEAAGVRVADAWMALRPAEAREPRLAISPYPAELTGTFDTPAGRLTIRPIRPEDAAAHAAFFARLDPEDVRYRFFSTLRELSAEQITRLTQVDYEREMAFVAVRPGREGGSETVGVARLVRESGTEGGEFAIIVQPDMKGTGLGRHLMQRLIDWGRARGMGEITGQVLTDNAPMLAFVRRLGFTLRRLAGEDGVTEARLALS